MRRLITTATRGRRSQTLRLGWMTMESGLLALYVLAPAANIFMPSALLPCLVTGAGLVALSVWLLSLPSTYPGSPFHAQRHSLLTRDSSVSWQRVSSTRRP